MSGWRFLSIMSKGRVWGWFMVSEAAHLSYPSPSNGSFFFWRVEWLQNHDVGQHACQLWLWPVLTYLNYFIPQKIERVAMGGQVYSHKSCLQCPNLEREGRGGAPFSGSLFQVLTALPRSHFIAA